MPDIVLRHKNTKVGKWVVPVPDGTDPAAVVAAYADSGWELDKKTDPADVPPAVVIEPAEPVNPKGN